MDTGDAIAVYAAAVATGAALWPVWQAYRARRPPVEVALEAARDQDEQHTRLVIIEVRNHGSLRIRIRAVGLTDGKATWTFQPGKLAVGPLAGPRVEFGIEQEFPHAVPPQNTRAFVLPENFVQVGKELGPLLDSPIQTESLALDIERPLQGWVWLETGQTVSTRARLDWSKAWVKAKAPDEPQERNE